jgi:hypothetical protein
MRCIHESASLASHSGQNKCRKRYSGTAFNIHVSWTSSFGRIGTEQKQALRGFSLFAIVPTHDLSYSNYDFVLVKEYHAVSDHVLMDSTVKQYALWPL